MPVQFILGDHPTEKRKRIIDHMYEQLSNNRDERMIYLVPDNVKYEAETMILEQFMAKEKDAKYSGMIRLQVFSFSRLAWYILQDKPIYQKQQLTETGLAMLLKNILQEEEKNLSIFRGASQHSGFIERLVSLFMELRNGKVIPSDLIEVANLYETDKAAIERQDFQLKMNDLSLLYQRYDEELSGKYIEKEDMYSELIQSLYAMKQELQNTHVIVDHYEHFSAQEQELLLVLARTTKNISIMLTLNEDKTKHPNNIYNPFYRSTKTYEQLVEYLNLNQANILKNLTIGSIQESRTSQNKDIIDIAEYWMESNDSFTQTELSSYQRNSKSQRDRYENIAVWKAENKNAELMHIATKIKKMVASGNYRYKDFQIMTRDLEGYRLNVEANFPANEIPYFIDQSESMSQHPLLEFIVSLFNLKKKHYRLNDIFRFLRTELYCPVTESEEIDLEDFEQKNLHFKNSALSWRGKVDIAENVALAYGYQGKDWIKKEDWHYARFTADGDFKQSDKELEIQEIANEVKRTFNDKIVPFVEKLSEDKTNRDIATALYNFMLDINVVDQIQFWRDQLIEDGDLEEARKHEQAWDTFITLLDEFVEVLGDEKWNIDSFISIMETGFEQATFSMVPPTIDQVLITNFDMPKIQSKRVVILIGLTDSQLPKTPSSSSLLTDEDRELIDGALDVDKYLATSEIESFANEPFAMYLALLQSREKLILTYPITSEDSKENRMSPYLTRIMKGLGLKSVVKYANASSIPSQSVDKITEEVKDSSPDLEDDEGLLAFTGSLTQTFGQMIVGLRHAIDNGVKPSAFWVTIFEKIYDSKSYLQNRLVRSLTHKNIPVLLTDELAEKLYGKDLRLSVSQLETFYADPYSHFLLYGLRLQERQIQELSALETGNFFHDALDLIANQLVTLKTDISQLTNTEIDQLTTDIFNLLLKSNKYQLARTSSRMGFIFRQLTKTVHDLVWSMVHQSKRSKLRIKDTELLFGNIGSSKGVPGLSFPLNNGGKLELRGKIDRIDTVKVDSQLYAGIVDYKSSETKFNYQKMYHGLMMQMITYLDTVLTSSLEIFNEPVKPLGAFYSRVHHPFIDLKDLKNKELETELLKQYKFEGLIVNQPEVLEAVDLDLESGHSPVYPIQLLKSGKYKHNNILTEEELELLFAFNQEMITAAGNRIISGEINLAPFDDPYLYTPSVRGSLQAISQFDALLPENNYKDMIKLDKKEFFDRLRDKYSKKEEEN